MSLETAIKAILSRAAADWTAAGDARRATAAASTAGKAVVPILAASGKQRPFFAYSITTAEDPSPTHDGPSGFTRGEFDLVIVTGTFTDNLALSAAAKAILDGFAGTVTDAAGGGTTDVKWVRFSDQTDIEQAPEPGGTKPPYVRSQTFTALIKDAA